MARFVPNHQSSRTGTGVLHASVSVMMVMMAVLMMCCALSNPVAMRVVHGSPAVVVRVIHGEDQGNDGTEGDGGHLHDVSTRALGQCEHIGACAVCSATVVLVMTARGEQTISTRAASTTWWDSAAPKTRELQR